MPAAASWNDSRGSTVWYARKLLSRALASMGRCSEKTCESWATGRVEEPPPPPPPPPPAATATATACLRRVARSGARLRRSGHADALDPREVAHLLKVCGAACHHRARLLQRVLRWWRRSRRATCAFRLGHDHAVVAIDLATTHIAIVAVALLILERALDHGAETVSCAPRKCQKLQKLPGLSTRSQFRIGAIGFLRRILLSTQPSPRVLNYFSQQTDLSERDRYFTIILGNVGSLLLHPFNAFTLS